MASAQVDDQFDLFGGFVTEIDGYLPVIAANLRRLLTTPGDDALLEESHRFAHTIKSSAGMMGMPELRQLATPMESVLARAYAGEIAVDPAVVETVEGTLEGVRRLLDAQKTGADVAAIVAANDQAYAGLATSRPAIAPAPPVDALDRLAHLAATSVDALDDALAPTLDLASPGEGLRPQLIVLTGDAEPLDELKPLVAASSGEKALPVPKDPPSASLPENPSSIAAEWLAEILRAPDLPTERTGDDNLEAPDVPAGATPAGDDRRLLDLLNAERANHAAELAAARLAGEDQLAAARQAGTTQLDAERRNHRKEIDRLAAAHGHALRQMTEERERALEDQRAELEREVQRYIDEDLRPQLEDDIRKEVAHEFEIAALIDPAMRPSGDGSRGALVAATADMALAGEIAEVFSQEAAEHVAVISEQVLTLRTTPEDEPSLQTLRRSVHTLKGAAATFGLLPVSTLCHQIESALDQRLQRNEPGEWPTLLLLQCCDTLEGLIAGDEAAVVQAHSLAAQLSVHTGLAAVESSARPAPAPLIVARSAAIPAAEAAGAASIGLPAAGDHVERDVAEHAVPPGPSLRDGATFRLTLAQYDRILAATHDLIIGDSAFEQLVERFLTLVADLHHAGTRLHVAAAQLEQHPGLGAPNTIGAPAVPLPDVIALHATSSPIGTEQPKAWQDTLRRYLRSGGGDSEFDSLELDRYTDYHRLTREAAEAASDVLTTSHDIRQLLDELRLVQRAQRRLHGQQNDILLQARMTTLRSLTARIARTVQTVAQLQGKTVELIVDGEDTPLDRAVLAEVSDALLHLARNAVDHGIESTAERLTLGKAAAATIRLTARRVGAEVQVTLSDDGRGIDTTALVAAARARGLLVDGQQPSLAEALRLIFAPGLSTAAAVSDVSGRGIGMDVVRANVEALGGTVQVESVANSGTTFILRLPSNLALLSVALVECNGTVYALPLALVHHVEKVVSRRIVSGEQGKEIRHGGRTYPVIQLSTLLSSTPVLRPARESRQALAFVRVGGRTVALAVDRVVGKRDVVVKDIGRILREVPGVEGATILGTGDLVLILDLPVLLERGGAGESRALPASAPAQRRLLVVDDSATIRRVTCALFARHGWQAVPARDGVEALDVLRDWRADAVLMDIEMPRMDGYELLAILKGQPETTSLPTVMVTSRAGDKHRDKAERLGVDAYLVKPFREEELLAEVERLVTPA